MLASKFIEAELNAYIQDQRLTDIPLMVKLISRAFEAYEEYKRLVSVSSISSPLKERSLKDFQNL